MDKELRNELAKTFEGRRALEEIDVLTQIVSKVSSTHVGLRENIRMALDDLEEDCCGGARDELRNALYHMNSLERTAIMPADIDRPTPSGDLSHMGHLM